MRPILMVVILVFLQALPINSSPLSDQQIRKQIIQDSIDSYPGSCPCPYNVDRAGRRCGNRSAWSKPGGYSPICYDSDISEEIIDQYRKQHNDGREEHGKN